jgi:uroporphyrinogen-III synthase
MGARVDELLLYRAAIPNDPDAEGLRLLRAGAVDIATFASSSAVNNLITLLGSPDPLRSITLAAIGPITAQTLRDAGLEPAVIASEHTVPGLVQAIIEHFA